MRVNRFNATTLGEDVVNKALSTEVEPTSRVMYNSYEDTTHLGKQEYAGEPIEIDGYQVTAYYYVADDEDICDVEPEFEIDEIW